LGSGENEAISGLSGPDVSLIAGGENMQRLAMFIGILLSISGCATGRRAQHALINDCSGGGYRVVAVDRHTPQRASKVYTTMLPVVVVSPGTHQVTVVHDRDQQEFELTAKFAGDLEYRIVKSDTGPEIVDWPHPSGPAVTFSGDNRNVLVFSGDYRDGLWERAQAEAKSAEADYVFHAHEFNSETHQLTTRAMGHLEHVARCLPHVPFPVVVAQSGDADLDAARRHAVVQHLTRLGSANADERVVVAEPSQVAPGSYYFGPLANRHVTRGDGGM
jgi:hypothetical protein